MELIPLLDKELPKGDYVLDFWADWCSPCHQMKMNLMQVDSDLPVYMVNAGGEGVFKALMKPVRKSLGLIVNVLPTLVLVKDGVPVYAMQYVQEPEEIKRFLEGPE